MKPKKIKDHNELRRRTIQGLLLGGVSALLGISGWTWIMSSREEDGIPWPLRQILRMNESIWSRYYKAGRVENSPPSPPVGNPVRLNGDLGLSDAIDFQAWKMRVDSPYRILGPRPFTLTLLDLRSLPKTTVCTEFKCIEGWTENFCYAGVRFEDFLKKFNLGLRSGEWTGNENVPKDFFPYVGLETPDRKYYVSIDMQSMLNPQTLLAYEMNGNLLSSPHGGPVRLIIPVKYGIKSLKRIGRIYFSDQRPPDYWEERGYDWYAGL